LGVHHNTVAEAYRQLATEGWLELQRRNGAIVRERRSRKAGPEAMDRFARPLRELVARALGEGLSPNAVAREMMKSARKLGRGAI
jgi:DNA-binding transcriptional regulator YhcF (GntR family)